MDFENHDHDPYIGYYSKIKIIKLIFSRYLFFLFALELQTLNFATIIISNFILFRGFLKSDKLIGTVNVKLQPLDNKCTVHDSYDVSLLMEYKVYCK